MTANNPEFGPDSGGRIKGVTVVKPVYYGNVARYFGRKRDEDGHTHQWTVYLRPYLNQDMESYVKKVHFKLHESYANQNRVLFKAPFEVTETGWGEFEIVIKIYFHDSNERPVTLYHILKLFQSGPEAALSKNVVLSEFYEEIVFQDPTAFMHHLLTAPSPPRDDWIKPETDFEEKKRKTLENILTGKTIIRSRITEMKEKLKIAKEAIAKFKVEIDKSKRAGEEATS